MNFSAGRAGRKWRFGRMPPVMVTAVTALLLVFLQLVPAEAARRAHGWAWPDLFGAPPRHRGSAHQPKVAKVPLPKPRPAEAPAGQTAGAPPTVPTKPVERAAPAPPPPPSACRQALTEEIAIAPSIPDIRGPGGCGAEDVVRLEAIVLPDKHRLAVTPPATLRCPMAAAIADWVRSDVAPLAESQGGRLAGLENFDSFDCRGRNGVVGAPLSEHGRANALDVREFRLADGRRIVLTDRNVPRDVRESMLHSACTRFTTVLGPGSDWYHEDHVHLDLMERHNNYKICQWDVWDPLPQMAPVLPAERPAQAPPREIAKDDATDALDADAPKRDDANSHAKASHAKAK